MSNYALAHARVKKNDEFYTDTKDIEQELQHYKEHFKGQTVYCNCDHPRKSNFTKYFVDHYDELQLKKLICTGYNQHGGGTN